MMMKSMNVLYDHADDPTRIKSFFVKKSFETETESHNAIAMIIKQLETHVVTYFLVSPSLSRLQNIIHRHCCRT